MDLTSRLDAEHLAVYRAMPDDLLAGLADDLPATRARDGRAGGGRGPPAPARRPHHRGPLRPGTGRCARRARAPLPPGRGLPSPAAALYWVHGGGMVMGSIAMNDDMCAAVADQLKILVASVEYRLAPEYPYPARSRTATPG